MKEEMSSLNKSQTWELVPRPKDKSIMGCKWIYKVKEGISDSEPIWFKARLVAKGFTQKEGVDFNEIFSPVVKYTTIHVILAYFDWELEQLDVKNSFLHGDLKEKKFYVSTQRFLRQKKIRFCVFLKKILIWFKTVPKIMV